MTIALRLATGDTTLRPHDLRHGTASESFSAICATSDEKTDALRLSLVGDRLPSRRHLPALSQCLGHSGCDITMTTYVHNVEFMVAEALSRCIPPMTSAQLGTLFGADPSWARRAIARMDAVTKDVASPAQILLARTLAMRSKTSTLHAWRDINYTTVANPDGIDLSVEEPAGWPDLPSIHMALRYGFERQLDPHRVASTLGLDPEQAMHIFSAYEDVCDQTRFSLPFANAPSGRPLGGAPIEHPAGIKTSPHLPSIVKRDVFETINASDEMTAAAMRAVTDFDIASSAWICDSVSSARLVAKWLCETGVSPHSVAVDLPVDSRDAACVVAKSFGPMGDAQFNLGRQRANSRRGYDTLKIRAQPFGLQMACPSFVQATHLWLVRELAKASFDRRQMIPNPSIVLTDSDDTL